MRGALSYLWWRLDRGAVICGACCTIAVAWRSVNPGGWRCVQSPNGLAARISRRRAGRIGVVGYVCRFVFRTVDANGDTPEGSVTLLPAHPRAIGWDLHHTLVGFMPSAPDRFAPMTLADATSAMELRPGAKRALERLSARGYLHYITTSAPHEHAEAVLQATGIRGRIAGIFSGLEIDVGVGKLYRPLAAALGLSDAEAAQRMVVVGDVIYDQPADIDGLVFIQQPDGFRQDAATVADMIVLLEDAAAGDMRAGFARLYSGARQLGRTLPRLGSGYLMPLTPGLTAYLEMRRPLWQGQRAGLETTSIPSVVMLTDEAIAYHRGELG